MIFWKKLIRDIESVELCLLPRYNGENGREILEPDSSSCSNIGHPYDLILRKRRVDDIFWSKGVNEVMLVVESAHVLEWRILGEQGGRTWSSRLGF